MDFGAVSASDGGLSPAGVTSPTEVKQAEDELISEFKKCCKTTWGYRGEVV